MTITFEEFRVKLADYVTVAINSRKTVGHRYYDHCPLGCWPTIGAASPGGVTASGAIGIPEKDAWQFISGFDRGFTTNRGNRFYKLGRLYRERFSRKP